MTERAWTKYELTLTSGEIGDMGEARTKRVIKAWAEENGVMNVKNHEIRAVLDQEMCLITYTASVKSEGWTGR